MECLDLVLQLPFVLPSVGVLDSQRRSPEDPSRCIRDMTHRDVGSVDVFRTRSVLIARVDADFGSGGVRGEGKCPYGVGSRVLPTGRRTVHAMAIAERVTAFFRERLGPERTRVNGSVRTVHGEKMHGGQRHVERGLPLASDALS
jgi:hypothetical protein